jgi:putative membrane protein
MRRCENKTGRSGLWQPSGIHGTGFDLYLKMIVMKTLIHFYISALTIFLFGCNNSADPVKEAKKENEEKIDSQVTTQSRIDSIAMVLSKEDADFMVNAASGGMFEVQLGQLAQTHSRNQRVKNFGAMMIKDQGEAGEKLKALAASKNITLPDSISNRQQKQKERLQKKSGAAFDETYINMMTNDHRKDFRDFEKQATNGTNPDIKAFASDNLKMLQTHLDSATNIQKTVSKKLETGPPPYY